MICEILGLYDNCSLATPLYIYISAIIQAFQQDIP